MEWDILKKEKEYLKENELIESKTKELFKQADDVLQSKNDFFKEICEKETKLTKKPKAILNSRIRADSEISLDDPFLPSQSALNDMGQKAVHHFYKAKIKALKTELEKLKIDSSTKNIELKQLEKNATHNAEEKEKWFTQYNAVKQTVNKSESQITRLSNKLQAKENENINLKKEIDVLKKEVQSLNKNHSSNEAKINKILEENEKYKASLRAQKKEEKDLKESHKKQIQELTQTVQHVEKQKMEILKGFKKQLQLIENLKQQKAHLQSFNLSQIAEAEYMKLLEWKEE